jgi:hypothetical protein
MTDKLKPRMARLEKEVQQLKEAIDSLTRLVEQLADEDDDKSITDLDGNRYK